MNQRAGSIPRDRIAATALLLSLACIGCGSKDDLPLAEVTGVVTLDGKPVGGVGIEYIPQEAGKSVAYGKTDEDGRYTMYFGQSKSGAFIGRNLVVLYCDDTVTYDGQTYWQTELFPPKYNVRSEQYVDVVEGVNEIDFHCESGEFKPRQRPPTAGAGT